MSKNRRLEALRSLRGEAPAEDTRVRLTLRVSQDVAEALALAKVRGHGTIAEQIEDLVRAREGMAARK